MIFTKLIKWIIAIIFIALNVLSNYDKNNTSIYSHNLEYDFNTNIAKSDYITFTDSDLKQLSSKQIIYDLHSKVIACPISFSLQDKLSNIIGGNKLLITNNFNSIFIKDFKARLGNNITIKAKEAKSKKNFIDTKLRDAIYTPCNCMSSDPFWSIASKEATIDLNLHNIKLEDAFLKIKKQKIFYLPYLYIPTPNAKSKSGLLIPRFEDTSLRIPIYLSIKSNVDATFTPRILMGINQSILNTMYEFEFRHLIANGSYEITGSIIPNDKNQATNSNNNLIDLQTLSPMKLVAKGDFTSNKNNLGFDINFVSNLNYLKKYYNDYTSYLVSKVYNEEISKNSFNSIELLTFYDLRSSSIFNHNQPIILPQYNSSYYKDISNHLQFINEINSAVYISKNKDIYRIVNDSTFKLQKRLNNFILDNKLLAQTKIYFYSILKENEDIRFANNNFLSNITPIAQSKISYPLIHQNIHSNRATILTPFVKLMNIATSSYEMVGDFIDERIILPLTKYNFLSSNYYSGLDFAESATKLAYGFDVDLNKNSDKKFNFFLSKVDYLNGLSPYNHDMISGVRYVFKDKIELSCFSHFDSKKLSGYRNDFAININIKKLRLSLTGVEINDIKKQYFVSLESLGIKDTLSQLNFDINHDLNDNWSLRYSNIFSFKDNNFDLMHGLIQNSYHITYKNECTLLSLGLVQNFTSDPSRNITNLNQYSIDLGLKTLNL